MKTMKTIYISGPITDPETGRPREGWQKDFLDAEQKLRRMGFHVINPIQLAKTAETMWKRSDVGNFEKPCPRWFYLNHCLRTLYEIKEKIEIFGNVLMPGPVTCRQIGLYVIGHPDDIRRSYGTMTEINFALSADMPVWSQYYHGYQMDNLLRQLTDFPTLAEAQQTLNE